MLNKSGCEFLKKDLILRDKLAIERTILANERTILAYLRTAITVFAAGVTFINFFKAHFLFVTGWVLMIMGIIIFLFVPVRFGTLRKHVREYMKAQKEIEYTE